MGKIIDFLLGLIAYVCVATVITIALIVGYYWHTDQLNSDKMFRLMALLQDVDLQQINASHEKKSGDDVPPQEPSLNEVMHRQHVQDRNYEAKLLALQRGKKAYDESFQKVQEKIDRYDRMVSDIQRNLKQQEDQTTQQNIATVIAQLEQVKPEVGKDAIMKWIDEQRMDDAIRLMSRMSENKRAKILKTFQTDKELSKLHEIHMRILTGGPEAAQLQKALNEIDSLGGSK
jgi:hypothetical protein